VTVAHLAGLPGYGPGTTMTNRQLSLVAIVGLLGCAHRPLLVNDPDNKDSIDLRRNGLLCFRTTATPDTDLVVEAQGEADGKTYRFALNPLQDQAIKVWVGPVVVHRADGEAAGPPPLTLYQFPPGKYRLRYLRLGTGPAATRLKATKRFRPAVFEIKPGEIAYAGDLEVETKWGLLLPGVEVQAKAKDDYEKARSELSKTAEYRIDRLELRRNLLTFDLD
jgi:hypothetical protein